MKPSPTNSRGPRCQRPITLKASYTLSRAANVSFTLQLEITGRKQGGRCVKTTRENRHDPSCVLLTAAHATITRSGVARNLGLAATLAAGIYELTATPAGSKPETVAFKVTG